MHSLFNAIWFCSMAAQATLLFRLARSGLTGTYRGFTFWVAVDLAFGVTLAFLYKDAARYQVAYTVGTLIETVAQAALTIEVFRAHHAHYPNTRRFGTGLFVGSVAVAVIASAFLSPLERAGPSYAFRTVVSVSRAINSSAALFLLFSAGVFAIIEVPTKPNVLIIERLCAAYFGVVATSLFILGITAGQHGELISLATQALTFAFFVSCSVALRKEGEIVTQYFTEQELAEAPLRHEEMLAFMRDFRWSPKEGLHGRD